MSTTKTLAIKAETIAALDKAAGDYQLVAADASPFQKTFHLANAMGSMRELLTPEIMRPIMALQNTDLGFRCDKTYDVEVVRDIVIESTLRGYFVVGNEFNIIAGRFYAAKNGVRRKVIKWPKLTDFKDTYEVPRMANGGAVVVCNASWIIDGKKDSIDREIPVKVNNGMGADAILGKAERKLLKSVLDRISGEITQDGEVGDEPLTATAPAKEKAVVGKATTVSKEAHHEVTPKTPEPSGQQADPADGGLTNEEKAKLAEELGEKPPATIGAAHSPSTPEEALRQIMAIDGITAKELGDTLRALRVPIPKDFKDIDQLRDDVVVDIMAAQMWQSIRARILNLRDDAPKANQDAAP